MVKVRIPVAYSPRARSRSAETKKTLEPEGQSQIPPACMHGRGRVQRTILTRVTPTSHTDPFHPPRSQEDPFLPHHRDRLPQAPRRSSPGVPRLVRPAREAVQPRRSRHQGVAGEGCPALRHREEPPEEVSHHGLNVAGARFP